MRTAATHSGNPIALDRAELTGRGRRLEYLTIAWNSFEAAVALTAGLLAGSIALVGFGFDSVIETVSAGILLWRFRFAGDGERSERAERTARRLVGICFLLLAAYVAMESLRNLWSHARPEPSVAGILIAIAAVIVMPLLGRAKRRLGARLGSAATAGEGSQNYLCAAQAAAVLAGLALTAAWPGGWWLDPVTGLGIAAFAVREGIGSWRGADCC